jgi:hypothetical protein
VTGLRSWVPEGLDLERPSGARIYDHLLDGGHNPARAYPRREPGIVPTPVWRPESPTDTSDDPARAGSYAAAGRRR